MLPKKSSFNDLSICQNWLVTTTAIASKVRTEDEQMINEGKSDSSRRSRSAVQMLVAEMSREMECNKKVPNVVARLMGLEALPNQAPVLTTDIRNQDYTFSKSTKLHQDGCLHNLVANGIQSYIPENYRDAYEVNRYSTRNERKYALRRDSSNNWYEKQIAFICQKFAEAKHLTSNEKILDSEEFNDVLDVLSSNRDMFLKILEEPNSMLSGHFQNLYATSLPSQKQHIIVLKPSKKAEWKSNKEVKKGEFSVGPENGKRTKISRWDSCFIQPKAERSPHPISIVVLKPSPGKRQDLKYPASSPDFSLKLAEVNNCNRGSEIYGTMESRDAGYEIRQQREQSICSQSSSQAQLSVASNDNVANDSSICKGEHFYSEIGCSNNFGDVTPTSENSCSYTNRVGSPSSEPSFSNASYLQEPSVTKEAKKRLSERWAMVSTGSVNLEPEIQDWGIKTTVAEMLAVSNMRSEGRRIQATNNWVTSSKNMPASTSATKNINVSAKASELPIGPSVALEDITRRLKSTVKGKLSSLFSSKNGTAKEKSLPSSSMNSVGKMITGNIDEMRQDLQTSCPEHLKKEARLANSGIIFGKSTSVSFYLNNRSKEQTSAEAVSIRRRSKTSNSFRRNQDQPSPSSVLDAPCKDDAVSCHSKNPAFSQSLSRSPPIESIVRSLSWNDGQCNTLFPTYLEKLWIKEDEEQARLDLVQKLLSCAGFDNEVCSSIFIRLHSLEIPLNPILASRFLNEGNDLSRRRECGKRLIFDSVNEALIHIGNHIYLDLHPWLCSSSNRRKVKYSSTTLVNEAVFEVLRDWHNEKEKWVSCDTKNRSQVVNSFARTELVGKKWVELSRLNMDGFSKEVCEFLLDELIVDSLSELIAE